ncbi:MAG: hypothetical protein J7L26_03430 [Candidatus Aminicenantes bacterium]|nr:hypothetical protein [Candidatus Aminicenantes bacterium]
MGIEFEYVSLDELKPLKRNPKRHDLGTLHGSFKRFQFIDPIIVNRRTGHVISGHGRLEALVQKHKSGEKPPGNVRAKGDCWLVPVNWVDVPEKEEEAAALALNRTVELGGWNEAELAEILSDLATIDALEGVGWTPEEVDYLLFSHENEKENGSTTEQEEVKIELKVPQCVYELYLELMNIPRGTPVKRFEALLRAVDRSRL